VELQEAKANVPVMQALSSIIIQHGWPKSKEDVPNAVRQYWDYRDKLSSVDGLLFRAHQLIVPRSRRKKKCYTASMNMNRIKVLSNANSEHETSYSGLACPLRLKIRCPSVPYPTNSREHNPKNQW